MLLLLIIWKILAKCQYSENLNSDIYARAETPSQQFSSFVEKGFLYLKDYATVCGTLAPRLVEKARLQN